MAAAATGMRDKVTFDPNRAVEVTTESNGQEQVSRSGETEYRYFLSDNRIMWVPEEAHAQIQRISGGSYPHSYRTTKQKAGRQVLWTVEDLGKGHASQPPSFGPRPQEEPPSLPPPAQASLTPDNQVGSTTYYTCLCAALRAAKAAEDFAREIQRPFSLDSSDIRAIATTLYIQAVGGRA